MTEITEDAAPAPAGAAITQRLTEYLEERTKTAIAPEHDLFASGLVSSMFAMELVVYLEREFGIVIVGADLKMVNFRTVHAMTELVLRLQDGSGGV